MAINIIREVINNWFQSGVSQALSGGVKLAIEYYTDKINILGNINNSPIYMEKLRTADTSPEDVWSFITSIYSRVSTLEILKGNNPFYIAGDKSLAVENPQREEKSTTDVYREDSNGKSMLRIKRAFSIDNTPYLAITTIEIPDWFENSAKNLTETREKFLLLDTYKNRFILSLTAFYGFFALPLTMIALILGFILSEEVLKPLMQIEQGMERISIGDYSYRILMTRKSDMSFLVRAFNRMLAEIEANREKIMHAEKISTWQDIAQQLAHEIKNPLTPIRLATERIRKKAEENCDDRTSEIIRSSSNIILREVERLTRLIAEFRDFSRLREPVFRDFDILAVFRQIVAGYAPPDAPYTIELKTDEKEINIRADQEQIKQALSNIIQNAIDAGEGKKQIISINLTKSVKNNREILTIAIRDQGKGITEERQRLIFVPYFTTKKHGTGLGLAIVQRIILDHNGNIWFKSEPEKGTTFFIELPLER
ncbi:ATP-binding protein [Spirochaetia bacterium 38H-sp]|uniref:histidine kinase n=1 Tax=Rarispira pelagica TaxID=3141764 RepID=A0ABU9U9C6_9SPIR